MASLLSSAFQTLLRTSHWPPSPWLGQEHLGSVICKDPAPDSREQGVEGQEVITYLLLHLLLLC